MTDLAKLVVEVDTSKVVKLSVHELMLRLGLHIQPNKPTTIHQTAIPDHINGVTLAVAS